MLDEGMRSRRAILKSAGALAGMALVQGCARTIPAARPLADAKPALPPLPTPWHNAPARVATRSAPAGVRPALFERAMAALDRHGSRIKRRDMIVIADFDRQSADSRFQFIHLPSGTVSAMRVAHGSGSDPAHSGRLHHFSNTPGSEATCEGAFLTDDYYVGQHGRSQRLVGLDHTNNNAFDRAIVIHGAWYANPEMIAQHGKLGRSQGCFAVAEGDLARVFALAGQGSMIYAGKA